MEMLKKIFDLHKYSDKAGSFSKDASQRVKCNAFSKKEYHSLKMRQSSESSSYDAHVRRY